MKLLYSVITAFSMFSSIPTPKIPWKQENMRYMLCALPLVGLVIGALWYGWSALAGCLGLGDILFAAGAVAISLFITGGIHLDGFADTVDALKSHASPDKKREILKDPRAGAFAVIFVGAYLLFEFALCAELAKDKTSLLLFALIPVMSRSLSAISGTLFPMSASDGSLKAFRQAAAKGEGIISVGWFCTAALLMALLSPIIGGAVSAVALLVLLLVRSMAKKEFGGMSGDIAGYLLCVAEISMLLTLVLTERILQLCI